MSTEGDRLPLVLATRVPIIAVALGTGFLRFLGKRRRGVRAFHRALVRGGMPRDQAAQLAAQYHELGSLRRILGGAGIPWLR
jgi:hypothetical protein